MRVKLGDVYTISSGGTPSKQKQEYYNNGSIKWVKTGDLKKRYLYDTEEYITEEGMANSSTKVYEPDTVLIAMYGATIGATSILKTKACTNQACAAFKKNEKVIPEYLYYFFASQKKRFIKDGVGGAQPNISVGYLKNIEINLVDYEEQKRVVEKLDLLTMVADNRKQQIKELEELVRARFVEMFGDFADPNCKHLKCKLIEACVEKDDIKCGPFGTQLNKEEYQSDGIAIWEIPQINNSFREKPTHYLTYEKAQQLSSYSIIPGDIVMSRKGNVGKCGLFPDDYEQGIMHSDVLRIRLDRHRVIPYFMMCQLHFSRAIQQQIEMVSSGAVMAGINVTKLKQIEVYIPEFKLQTEFVDFITQCDKSKFY